MSITTIQNQTSLVPESEPTFLSALERIATNPNVPVETIERLLAVQERVMGKRAEEEFHVAMSDAQSEMGRVSADADNPQTHSKYASYGQLDRAIRPIYTKHGFALSFDESESPKAEHLRMLCYVSHRGGHTRTYRRDMPVTMTGLKGNANMTSTHASASAQSYAMRYLLKMIFNVAIGEDDNDGNNVGPRISEKQAADLRALLEEVKANEAKFLAYIKTESIEAIPAKNFDAVCKIAAAKRKRQP